MADGVPRARLTPGRLRDVIVRTRTLAMFDELASYGGRAVEFRLPGETSWLLTDPSLARRALTAPTELVARSSRYRRLSVLLGRSLLTTDGAEHRVRRRLIQPAFSRDHLAGYATAMAEAAAATDRSWRVGAAVEMQREMAALTLDAVGRAVLGIDGRARAVDIGEALDALQRAIALLLVPGAVRLLDSGLPVVGRLHAAAQRLREVSSYAAVADTELVRALRRAADGADRLGDDELRDELLTLLLAGHETTAMTLTWAWWFLDRHPQVAQRMRSEHDAVLGDTAPGHDAVDALPYTAAVVAETLRLRPAAWIIERETTGDLDLDGLRPRRGTLLLVSPWVLHRSAASWTEPAAFTPERWLTAEGRFSDEAPGQPRGAWLPFGAGTHVCVGAAFAWTESVIALATLARRWRPRSVDPGEVPLRATATLRPARPVRMCLERIPSPAR